VGHDISGYIPTDRENEIAYLRRGAFGNFNSEIYKALNCLEYYGGVSGNGGGREFSFDELIKALEYLGTKKELEYERRFICDCISNTGGGGKIFISFC